MNDLPKYFPVTAMPNAHETAVIYRAQSMLTRNGKLGPVLSYPDALLVTTQRQPSGVAADPLSVAECASPVAGVEGSGTLSGELK